ncbi:MAG: DUF58 domain-containing protein [Alphaproteobacteria bacterium]|nr:DUF58 domain-containing protein [Alphaproteobacteria bacterium]
MKSVRQLARRWFGKTEQSHSGNGLFATPEELMEQRRYTAYLRNPQTRLATSAYAGDVKSAFKGRGIEMEEIRPYSFGDDVRDIDWRVTARKMQPYTKLFAEERDREVFVLLDLSPQMLFGTRNELKSVSAAKIAALLGWMSLENKDRFGCVIFDGQDSCFFKPQNHRAGILAVLKKISETSRQVVEKRAIESQSLAKPLQLLQKNVRHNAIVFVLSDFNGEKAELHKPLAALARKTNLYCVNIFDVLEELAPRNGEYMAEYGGQKLVFDSGNARFRQEYCRYFEEKRQEFRDFCHKFSCRCIEIRTDMPLYRQMQIV